MSNETNVKFFALREAIKTAIKQNTLENEMDVIKLQAVEMGMDLQLLDAMIEEEKQNVLKEKKLSTIVAEKKTLIICVCIAAVAIEWFLGLRGGGSFLSVIGLLVVNIITLVAIVLGFAYYFTTRK